MTSAILAVLLALQVGQGFQNVSGTKWCSSLGECLDVAPGRHTDWSAMMPLVEPLPPQVSIVDVRWGDQHLPSVVPAIQEKGRFLYTKRVMTVSPDGETSQIYDEDIYEHQWTCADPKRVLLSSEDGSGHWCVRF